MKKILCLLVLLVFPVFLLEAFASCIVNEDWKDAPCLDSIVNGKFDQREVDKWRDYYQYKGTEWMQQKRAEMEQEISKGNLKEWIYQSTQNHNVYSYYFFSGRAPDIGEYHFGFDKFVINESSTIHNPYTDDERYQLAESKIPLGGFGLDTDFSKFIIAGIVVGVGIPVVLLIYWRRK